MHTEDQQLKALLNLESAIADCIQMGLSNRDIRRRTRRTLSGRRGFHPFNACWRADLLPDFDVFWHQNVLCWRIWSLPGDALYRMVGCLTGLRPQNRS